MRTIYEPSGYVDIGYILKMPYTFIFVMGGRATGKTYGAFKSVFTEQIKFIYMRRTQTQLEMIANDEYSPHKKCAYDMGLEISLKSISANKSKAFFNDETKDILGYSMALSTIANLRGFDASDVDLLVYDEFIPERHEKAIKHEAFAFFNAYETINRNRELEGRPPLKFLGLSNSNSLANPIFMNLQIVNKIWKSSMSGSETYINDKLSLAVYNLGDSTISEQKKNTALYKLAGEGEFSRMAINNQYEGVDSSRIKSENLKEYKSIVQIGEITIYEHKSKKQYYASSHKSGSPFSYGTSDLEIERFRKNCSFLYIARIRNIIYYENLHCQAILTYYFK